MISNVQTGRYLKNRTDNLVVTTAGKWDSMLGEI